MGLIAFHLPKLKVLKPESQAPKISVHMQLEFHLCQQATTVPASVSATSLPGCESNFSAEHHLSNLVPFLLLGNGLLCGRRVRHRAGESEAVSKKSKLNHPRRCSGASRNLCQTKKGHVTLSRYTGRTVTVPEKGTRTRPLCKRLATSSAQVLRDDECLPIAETDEGFRKAGEALWPERFPLSTLEQIRQAVGGGV